MPARAVTRECDALRIDLAGQRLDGGDDVVERRGPVAVAVEPAVLDVPDGEAAHGEIRGDAVLEVAPVLRAPAAAVDQHDGRMRGSPPAGSQSSATCSACGP